MNGLADLVRVTLDVLIVQTLSRGPLHDSTESLAELPFGQVAILSAA